MGFRDDVERLLSGGLPAVFEIPNAPAADPEPEKIEPEPQLKDREAFALGGVQVTQNQALIGGAALLGIVALVFMARSV